MAGIGFAPHIGLRHIPNVGLNGFAVAGCGTVAGCADPGYDFEGRELISASSLEERIA
jgi:hypothetical protein